jgi:hypothetical protein
LEKIPTPTPKYATVEQLRDLEHKVDTKFNEVNAKFDKLDAKLDLILQKK